MIQDLSLIFLEYIAMQAQSNFICNMAVQNFDYPVLFLIIEAKTSQFISKCFATYMRLLSSIATLEI